MTEPKPNLEQLLRTGVAAARVGNRSAARALFLALTRAYPGEVRAWLGLAGVAESAQEQRAALEYVIAIDPEHTQARAALAKLAPAIAPPEPTAEPISAPPPRAAVEAPQDAPAIEAEERPATAHRFPLLNLIAVAIIVLLIIALAALLGGLIPGRSQATATTAAQPSPVLQAAVPTPAASALSAEPIATLPPATPAGADLAAPTAMPSAIPPVASLPAPASLPLGTLVEVDGWSTTLLRPDYALILDGSIGDLKPAGRFVLTLMAISNNSDTARRIPADLFALVDNQGRRYSPATGASSTYLALYERGQRGDLALEDSLAPRSGMRSVPIIFDVPLGATGLVLTVQGSGAAGWPIEGDATPPANVGP